MARDDIAKDGIKTQFSKKNQPKKRRGSSNEVKDVLKAFNKKMGKKCNVTIDTIRNFAKNFLFTHTYEDIEKWIYKEKGEIPAFFWGLSAAFMKDCVKGRGGVLSWLTELVYGKAEQHINIKAKDDISKMTREQQEDQILKLQEQFNKQQAKKKEKEEGEKNENNQQK